MDNNSLNIYHLKDRIINLIVSAGAILAILIMTAVFIRDYPDHLGLSYIFKCFLISGIFLAAIFRKKISLYTKVYTIVVILFFFLIDAFTYLGYLTSSKLFIVMTPALMSFVVSYKRALYILLGFLLTYAIAGYLFVNGIAAATVNPAEYIVSPISWITEFTIIFLTSFCILYVGNNYLKEIHKSMAIIDNKNQKLKANETELIRHKEKLEELVKERTDELQEANQALLTFNNELKSKSDIIHSQNTELKDTLEDLKNAQAHLLQSEKMASLGILTAGVAHEINNPLNYIQGAFLGLTNYFEEHGSADEKRISLFLESLETGVNRASSIVHGLNQFSRNSTSFDEDCDIHAIINDSLTMINNLIKDVIIVNINYTNSKLHIKGNVGNLHQVFINILLNAIQAMEGNGCLTINTQIINGLAHISFTDTGVGIRPENIKKLTIPFYTTKAPGVGTGLGLSITFHIIEEHKGKLKFESELGKGTTVHISIPINEMK